MTNVTTQEMVDFEIAHNVAMPCNVILTSVTVGGLVAPICHVSIMDTFNFMQYQ